MTNINIIQYGHGNILKSGLKGIQIIMFSRVAYVGAALLPIRTPFKLSNQPCNRKLNNARVNSQGAISTFSK